MINFKTLKVWELTHKITLDVYKLTSSFPKEEIYGLTLQMRRSSSSIPTNIAEGCGRSSDLELSRFLVIAMGSASELEYQLILSLDLKYIEEDQYKTINTELIQAKKMLNAFIKKINERIN